MVWERRVRLKRGWTCVDVLKEVKENNRKTNTSSLTPTVNQVKVLSTFLHRTACSVEDLSEFLVL